MKLVKEDLQVDAVAEDTDRIEVSIQHETGYKGRVKLYINVNGVTILRMCKIVELQLYLDDERCKR